MKNQSENPKLPSLLSTILFTGASVLAFCVWAFGSGRFESEVSMYVGCAVVFFIVGGLALLPVAKSNGLSPVKIALVFVLGFAIYAILWSVFWFLFRNRYGEIYGSFLGLASMIAIFRIPFKLQAPFLSVTCIAFAWHTLGYYTGDLFYAWTKGQVSVLPDLPMAPKAAYTMGQLGWGLFYGLGMGTALTSIVNSLKNKELKE